jgi:hypothetical protein
MKLKRIQTISQDTASVMPAPIKLSNLKFQKISLGYANTCGIINSPSVDNPPLPKNLLTSIF